MIVRNEAHQLAECLGPVADLFDEIVIVDTGSSDETPKVAAQFTSHLFHAPWRDDFSAARNESLRHATSDWIFWLDADDRISPDNVDRLRRCFAQLSSEPQAYLMNTACRFQYACEGSSLITHARLFRRDERIRWRGRVHEQIWSNLSNLGYELVWSDVQIDHTGYQDTATEQRKLARNLRLLRMDYATDPDDTSTLTHLGLAYFHAHRFDQARLYLRRLLSLPNFPGEHLRHVYGVLATMDMRDGKPNDALATIDLGLEMFPSGDYLQYLKAECLYELNRFSEAREALLQVLKNPPAPQFNGCVPAEIRDRLAPLKLADICRLEGKFDGAESLLTAILARYPSDTHTWHALGRVFIDSRNWQKLCAAIDRLKSCPQGEIFADLLLAYRHLQMREFESARQAIDRLIAAAPLMPMPRIMRVELLNQVDASYNERIQACRDLLRMQPGNREAHVLLGRLEAVRSSQRPQEPAYGSIVLTQGLAAGVA
jgi:glycosyltransferase involved in cell wall biosynthesis